MTTKNAKLFACSFHSTKGGVGKSTLALTAARYLASSQERPVFLIDLDLTGTSLADVLPLKPPIWRKDINQALQLGNAPTGFTADNGALKPMTDDTDALKRLTVRENPPKRAAEDAEKPFPQPYGVPFLNDFLFHATQDWDGTKDILLSSLCWQMETKTSATEPWVIPSSAVPDDLIRAIPVIFDEEHAAYLEARLEYLLAVILKEHQQAVVVFDTPPTIPGLSHSILSLALRLSSSPHAALSPSGFIPEPLKAVPVVWQPYMVTTPDTQDLKAVTRWLDLGQAEKLRDLMCLIINRHYGAKEDTASKLKNMPGLLPADVARLFIANTEDLQYFSAEKESRLETEAPNAASDLFLALDELMEDNHG